ncbi:MAG: amidohydrolase, partial [Verrucomicrobia bacterium]
MRCKLAVYSLIFMSAAFASAQPRPTTTLIITNAAVYTVDKQHPRAEAVAVVGDRIVAVGSRAE